MGENECEREEREQEYPSFIQEGTNAGSPPRSKHYEHYANHWSIMRHDRKE